MNTHLFESTLNSSIVSYELKEKKRKAKRKRRRMRVQWTKDWIMMENFIWSVPEPAG